MSRSPIREQSLPRFALRRDEAAATLGISPSLFDGWIADGTMPKGRKIGGVVLWDTQEIWNAWAALRDGVTVSNPLDKMIV